MTMTFFCSVSTLFLSYLFVDAGYKKLSEFSFLQRTIAQYRVLPPSWSTPMARILPLMELGLGLGLLIPLLHSVAALAVCAVLMAYSGAIALNIARGRRDLDCGCAGPGAAQNISAVLLVRNAVLCMLALVVASSPLSQRVQLGIPEILLTLVGAVLCALIYQAINQLLANQDKLRRIASHG
jgi:uncharacterized membrane protein YphA (DoxX/SURF4 family)